jgi:hypothetical protein
VRSATGQRLPLRQPKRGTCRTEGWLRVSMGQIASVSFLDRSIWAFGVALAAPSASAEPRAHS